MYQSVSPRILRQQRGVLFARIGTHKHTHTHADTHAHTKSYTRTNINAVMHHFILLSREPLWALFLQGATMARYNPESHGTTQV